MEEEYIYDVEGGREGGTSNAYFDSKGGEVDGKLYQHDGNEKNRTGK